MNPVYGFRGGPQYRGITRQELFDSAMDQPLSIASTLYEGGVSGVLDSFGLGTAIRSAVIPEGVPTPESRFKNDLRLMNPLTGPVEIARRTAQAFVNEPSPTLDEKAYKASPWYRDNIPWDAGMTELRARTQAEWDDARSVRQFYAEKRPITSFIGGIAGQALDPINYVPVAGPLVKAAAAAKFGRVAGVAATGAVDAAANTALFGIATREPRRAYGDDVSWQTTISEIATAALIGSAFGAVGGVLEGRATRRAVDSLSTLKTTQESRIALNEAIDAVVRGEDVRLTPNATEPMRRVATEVERRPVPRIAEVDTAFAGATDLRPQTVVTPTDIDLSKPRPDTSPEGRSQSEARGKSVPALIPKDLDELIEAELLQSQRERFRGVLTGMKARLHEIQDAIPDDMMDVLDTAIQRNDAQGWANLRTAKQRFEDEGRTLSSDVEQLFDDFDIAFNTPVSRRKDPDLRKHLETEYVNNITAFRAESLDMLHSWETAASSGEPGWSRTPIEMKALRDVIAEKEKTDLIETAPQAGSEQPPRQLNTTAARPDPVPEGRAPAEAAVGKRDDPKAIAEQHRVNPETGDFPEMAEIDQLRAEGRLTAEDVAELDDATKAVDDADAYGEALKSVGRCLI